MRAELRGGQGNRMSSVDSLASDRAVFDSEEIRDGGRGERDVMRKHGRSSGEGERSGKRRER